MVTFQSITWAIPIGFAAVLSGALALLAWRRRSMPMAPAFAVMMAGEAAWALGAALEASVRELPIKRMCIELRVLGALVALLGLLAFVLRYSGGRRWLRALPFGLIAAPGVVLVALNWTDRWHHLYWAGLANREVDGLSIAVRQYGPGYWAFCAYGYTIVAVSSFLLARAAVRASGVHRAQALLMLFGVLLPWIAEVVHVSRVFGFAPVDLVSVSFAVTGLTFLPALFRFHLLELPPVAWTEVVAGMDDPVVVMDPCGRIVELNPAARALIDAGARGVIGAEAARAFASWTALADRLARAEACEQRFEIGGPAASRASVFDARISPLGGSVRPLGRVLVLRDVTRLKRAAEERVRMLEERAARVEAEAANRAKDRFLATLSHELRTPLTPVLATTSALLDDPATPSSIRPVLEMIRRNVDLEARLIEDLLDLTRINRGVLIMRRERIDAHEQVLRVIEICGDEVEAAGLTMISRLAAPAHHIDADPARLQQVLWNLLKNAIKFSPAGGKVIIRTRNIVPPEGEDRPRLVIEVIDRGIGIDAEVLPRIFNMFEQGCPTTGQKFGGLGVGLAIGKSIVEHHGGRMGAASAGPGQGTTLSIELPTVAAPVKRPAVSPPARRVEPSRAHTILLVEDNKDTLKYLSAMLNQRGHLVRTAANIAAAVREASEADVDLLISDIELPDGSGLELMRTLSGISAVKGIALSGYGSSDDIDQSRSAGFSEHLIKPVEFRRLEQAIQQVMAGTEAGR